MPTAAHPAPPRSAAALRRAGILIALLGMLMFALNDVMGKWLVSTYSVGQVLLLRSAAALLVLAPILWRSRARLWPLERPWLQTARVAASTLEVYCFYFAVTTLPLANVMTYWLAGPIYVAALSPWLLGERVGPWRWAAILVGFAGVVVALRPGAEPPLARRSLVSLFGSTMFAFMVRQRPHAARHRRRGAGVLADLRRAGRRRRHRRDRLGRALARPTSCCSPCSAIVAMLAHLLIARSLKLADAATVAPLQYTLLLWAIVFGWLIFSDTPEAAILAGAVAHHRLRAGDLVARDPRRPRGARRDLTEAPPRRSMPRRSFRHPPRGAPP